jgi:hypothetical protein
LIAAADAPQNILARSFVVAAGAKQQPIHLWPRDAVVSAGSADAANFLPVDPLLDGGQADTQLKGSFAGFQQLLARTLPRRLSMPGHEEWNPTQGPNPGQQNSGFAMNVLAGEAT